MAAPAASKPVNRNFRLVWDRYTSTQAKDCVIRVLSKTNLLAGTWKFVGQTTTNEWPFIASNKACFFKIQASNMITRLTSI